MKMPKVVKTQVEFEGRTYEETIVIEGDELETWKADHEFSTVGYPETRIDGDERVTGSAKFTHDMQLPGMLYGKFLRSPYAHARIKSIDSSQAEALPGVRLIMSKQNTDAIPWRLGATFLFDEHLRYAGDEVACVLADSEEICTDAIELIEVDYEMIPLVLDPMKAQESDAPQLHEQGNYVGGQPEEYERGNVKEGFESADVVIEETFKTQFALHNCMETHGCVATWDGDNLTLYESTQNIHGVRDMVAGTLGLAKNKVRVIKKFMGGGFGSKNGPGKYTLIAALAAKETKRPVKILVDRREENIMAGNRPSTIQEVRVGAKQDGTLTAISHISTINQGAFSGFLSASSGATKRLYACPNMKTIDRGVHTTLGPMAAFRAPGFVEGTFAFESAIEDLANKLGIDPLEFRLKNYSETDPTTGKEYTTKGLRQAYERGAELIDWANRKKNKQKRSTEILKVGYGMASQIWGGSGGPPAYAVVKINNDGTAVVLTGTQEIGTGAKTALAQIAAESLKFPLSAISVELGDTQSGLYSPLSAGSMTLASVGPAVRMAAEDAREQLLNVGTQVLEISIENLVVDGGDFVDRVTHERTPVGKIYEQLQNFQIIGRGSRGPNPSDKIVNTFGAQFAEVEVNVETGKVRVKKIVAVHESGRIINPLSTRSQLEGGIIQGLGFALSEKRYDDPRFGLVLNPSLENYKIPTAVDIPEIIAEMVDLPDMEVNNIGSKGVGEPPIIPTAAAIANAVADAIGKRIYEIPFTPDRVLNAIYDNE